MGANTGPDRHIPLAFSLLRFSRLPRRIFHIKLLGSIGLDRLSCSSGRHFICLRGGSGFGDRGRASILDQLRVVSISGLESLSLVGIRSLKISVSLCQLGLASKCTVIAVHRTSQFASRRFGKSSFSSCLPFRL